MKTTTRETTTTTELIKQLDQSRGDGAKIFNDLISESLKEIQEVKKSLSRVHRIMVKEGIWSE